MPLRPSVAYSVYINGVLSDGIVTGGWQPMRTFESAGGKTIDHATIEVQWNSAPFFYTGLEDFNPYNFIGLEIEIVRTSNSQVVHWGKVTQLPTLLSGDSGETLELVSRAEIYLLGDQVDGFAVWDPIAAAASTTAGDLVFNPMIDGVIYGNLNDTKTTGAGGLLFLDPESVRTPAAQTLQGANVIHWTLSQAVYYLLWDLNTPQTHISNPDETTLNAVFNDPTALVNEVRIPRGTHLAHALDHLIEPLGYRWKMKRTDLGARVYEFFKKGTGGTLRSVYHQRALSDLSNPRDLGETNVYTAGLTFDVANLANEFWIRGGFGEYEVTVELVRGWAAAKDPTGIESADIYEKTNPKFNDNRDIMRKWVLNEAGDYIGLRTGIDNPFTSEFRTRLTALSLLPSFNARRRRFMPTMTQKRDVTGAVRDWSPIGTLDGVEVEYCNAATKTVTGATNASPIVVAVTGHGLSTGDVVTISGAGGNTAANGTWSVTVVDLDHYSLDGSHGNGSYSSGGNMQQWKPIKGMDCALLEHECGVYFDGDRVPDEFFEDLTHLKIRVTATIQSDFRLTGHLARQMDSPNPDVVPLTLDLPDRFRHRIRDVSLSKYGRFTKLISAVTNATPIVVATTEEHGFTTGDSVVVENVTGTTAANGKFKITVADSTHFSLDGSHGNAAYISGGAAHLENESGEIDDTIAIAAFAGSLRDPFDVMDISGPIQLEGLDNDLYQVGDRIENIYGKNVSFLCRDGSTAYPQIVAIERDIEQQLLTIHLEHQRDPIQLPPPARGNTPRFRQRSNAREFV